MTILLIRPSFRNNNLYESGKINQLRKVVNNNLNDLGGLLFKIFYDDKGIIISIIFGLKNFTSKYKDELISIIFAFEVSKQLKEFNIYPYIGISSNLVYFNLNKFAAGRRDFNIIGDAYYEALQLLEESEKIFRNKNTGEDSIIIDKNTIFLKIIVIFLKRIK